MFKNAVRDISSDRVDVCFCFKLENIGIVILAGALFECFDAAWALDSFCYRVHLFVY